MRNIKVPLPRHEIKFLLSYPEYVSLAAKLKHVMPQDAYTTRDGDYFIRSLYLDDMHRTAYTTKVAGVDNRTKYRIRCYNHSSDVIRFECKKKANNKIVKTSFPITYKQYCDFMSGDSSFLTTIDHPLAETVYGLVRSRRLAPTVIVDYDREAYVHPLSNTRLTFDKALRSGISSCELFDDSLITLPCFDHDEVIFEVKYDEYLPSHIAAILSTLRGEKLSLSKFCMCKEKQLEVKKYDIQRHY